jgi:hypothetical protein
VLLSGIPVVVMAVHSLRELQKLTLFIVWISFRGSIQAALSYLRWDIEVRRENGVAYLTMRTWVPFLSTIVTDLGEGVPLTVELIGWLRWWSSVP